VSDHVILLSASQVQLCGDTDDLLASHKILVGPRKDTSALEKTHTVVHTVRTARQSRMLVRLSGPVIDPAYEAEDVSLEEMVLGYMGADAPSAYAHLTSVGEDQ
jgi:ABC-2 type transport system ATP-binding protein